MTSRVYSLSPDHVVSILVLLSAEDISCLYECGSSHLNRLLAFSVTTFHVDLMRFSSIKWPRIISHFPRLQDFSVAITSSPHVPIPDVDISIVPKSVQKLHLGFMNGLFSLLQLVDSEMRMMDLKRFFPDLTHLSWHDKSCLDFENMLTHPILAILPILPIRLQSLNLANITKLYPKNIAQLPRSLLILRINLVLIGFTSEDDPKWPSNLTDLRIHSEDASQDSLLSNLPESLTFFKWKGGIINLEAVQFPRNLQSIILDNVSHIAPKTLSLSLPNGLTRFKATCKTTIEATIYEDLPPSLILLDINPLRHPIPPEYLKYLPIGISKLSNYAYSTSSANWHHLPRNLEKMEITGYSFSDDTLLAYLPSNLVEVIIYAPRQPILIALPTTVTSIMMGDAGPLVIDPTWMNHLTRLQSLDMRNGVQVDYAKFKEFTPSLTTVRLHRPFHLNDLDWSSPWTKNLTTIATGGNYSNIVRENPDEAPIPWIQRIPPFLTSLSSSSRIPSISSSELVKLPRTLKTFKTYALTVDGELEEHLAQLPKNLTELGILHTLKDLKGRDVHLKVSENLATRLPASLTSINTIEVHIDWTMLTTQRPYLIMNTTPPGKDYKKQYLQLLPAKDA
jgi:hypothetical protein